MKVMGSSLGLSIIFKNEEAYLKRCLDSVLPLVSEAVLVDSGSIDSSRKILQNYASSDPRIRVIDREWPENFADQRNFALSQMKSDWILVLDGDECLDPKDHPLLKEALEIPHYDAYFLPIWNYTRDFTELGFVPSSSRSLVQEGHILTQLHRLFRNHKNYRYEGILHERIEPSLEKEKARMMSLDLVIHHFGKLKERDFSLQNERYRFYENLGKKKLALEPNDPQAHWELGVIYQKQKKWDEAERSFLEAYRRAPDVDEFETYYALVLFQRGNFLELSRFQAKYPTAQTLILLAKAQNDVEQIVELEKQLPKLSQLPLFLLELALRHHLSSDEIARYQKLASESFGASGIVEFLEGSCRRKEGQFKQAFLLLQKSFEKGYRQSALELMITANQLGEFQKVIDFGKNLKAEDRAERLKEFQIVEDFARAQLKLEQNK